MTTRNRHLKDIEISRRMPVLVCSVCGTENEPHDATAEFAPVTAGDKRTVCLCEDCQQDFISETDQDDPDNVFNTDVLSAELFEQVLEWARHAAVMSFTEKENTPTTIKDVEDFFDALTAYLIWHPDTNFTDYVQRGSKGEQRIFTDEEAKDLNRVMRLCGDIIVAKGDDDIHGYGLASLQRAGLAPTEKQPTPAKPVTKQEPEGKGSTLLQTALELIAEACRLIPEDANERTIQWHKRKAEEIPAPQEHPRSEIAPMKRECLFVAVHAAGIGYSDKNREKDGDYLRLCFLPYSTLDPQWTGASMSQGLRAEIESEILSMQIRCGSEFEVSATGQSVLLGQEAEDGLALKALMKKFPKMAPRNNCLEDMACPSCGEREAFKIRMEVTMTLQDNGTEGDYGDTDWDENSYCECSACGYSDIAKTFTFRGLDDLLRDQEPSGDPELDRQGD